MPSQLSFPDLCAVTAAVSALSHSGAEERGAIFTRREVVDFILDLVGYTADRPLHQLRLLEPSFGDGSFLLPAIERLMAAWKRQKDDQADAVATLSQAIRGVELHTTTYEETRKQVLELLTGAGIPQHGARVLCGRWLSQGDFLLDPLEGLFDAVIGNPPYVRQEMIPTALINEYRSRYRTIYDRADLYIPFIERSLETLGENGRLGFICADRWMKNRYGGPLRELVATRFHLKCYVDMVDTPAFHSEVSAYPAITIIAREKRGPTRIAHRPQIDRKDLLKLAKDLLAEELPAGDTVRELEGVTAGSEPWILESEDQLDVLRRLEADFPTLEEAECKVGIGVATGADKAFIGPMDELDVEPDRKIPLAMTRDILSGSVEWRGLGVVNPFAKEGGLVNLKHYPRLKKYLEARKDAIAGRHVAQKAPANWYRTIDRIYPELGLKPKLLIPDIKGKSHVVYEDGQLYPHHNLYYVVSDEWNLKALQAVLLSDVARLFISIYSTKMRGGYLRFQAQYLRRIRIPHWRDVPARTRAQLIKAAERQDRNACNEAVFKMYGLTEEERAAVGGNGASKHGN